MMLLKPVPYFKYCSEALAVLFITAALCSCMVKKPLIPASESIAEEINRLSALIDETGEPAARSVLYETRARLRIRADNPTPDYEGALDDFSNCLELAPEGEQIPDILNWVAVLERLGKTEKETTHCRSRNKKTGQQNSSLKKRIAKLEQQERVLKESIKELQSLEILMENRRRQFK